MNWESVGAIGEVVGAIAVVVSIVYLALQIKSNTKAVRANAGFEATHSWATFNEAMANLPDENLGLLMRSFDPNEDWSGFSDIERTRIGLSFRALFQKLEGQYFLYTYEHLDEGLWKTDPHSRLGCYGSRFSKNGGQLKKNNSYIPMSSSKY